MSKPITGVAMMMLFEDGRWQLDDPITKFVPEFKALKVMSGADENGRRSIQDMQRPPTMRELMSHTAGFGYGLADQHPVDKLYREKGVLAANGLADMIKRTAEIPLMFQPGTKWSYSSAVDIQGYIVEKLSGQKFGDFLQQRIFKPLKMTDTRVLRARGQGEPARGGVCRQPEDRQDRRSEGTCSAGRCRPTSSRRRWNPAAVGWWARSATTRDSHR